MYKFCTFLLIFFLINLIRENNADVLSPIVNPTSIPLIESDDQIHGDLSSSPRKSRYPFCSDIPIPPGLIPDGYDNFERPTPRARTNKSTVSVQLSLHGIRGLNEKDEVLKLLMDLQFFWVDERLNTTVLPNGTSYYAPLDPRLIRFIWHPHFYIPQLVTNEQPGIVNPPQGLRMSPLFPVIYYTTRSTVGIACQTNYTFYPKDVTTCTFVLASYMYSDKTLELDWLDFEALNVTSLKLSGFEVTVTKGKTLIDYNYNWTAYKENEVSSRVKVIIILRRHIWDQLVRTYIPSSSFVVISWCSFLIPKDNALERTGIALGSLMSLMVLHNSVGQTISHVTELTALHVWVLACILFVFLPLIETLVVIKLWSLQKEEKGVEVRKRSLYKMRKVIVPTCCSFKSVKTIDPEMGGAGGGDGRSEGFIPMNMNFGLDLTNLHPHATGTGSGSQYSNEYEITKSNTNGNANTNGTFDGSVEELESGMKKPARKMEKVADTIERVTRIFLPSAFLLFNSAYWPWLINGANQKPRDAGRMYEVPNYF